MADIMGVVLAGGLSRRMEGREKSLVKLGGIHLVKRISDRMEGQVPELIVNANGDARRFSFMGKTIVKDTIDGYAGPLAGVLAGMRWAQQNSSATHIVTAAADTPFFPTNYVANMTDEAKKKRAQIALAFSNGRRHPVFGLWSVELADALEAFLVNEEGRKVMLFVERFSNCLVEFGGQNPDPFFNVNTPDDMKLAEQYAVELGCK